MRPQPLRPFALVALATLAALLGATPPAFAQLVLSDGGSHNVSGVVGTGIQVSDGPGATPTTLNVLPGASIGITSNYSITVGGTSILNMSGGSLAEELFLNDNSSGHITGGEIPIEDITTSQNATVVVDSATVGDDLEAHNFSTMTINGGTFDEDVESTGNATINIYGGNFQAAFEGSGGGGANVAAGDSSVINIHGGAFGTGETDGQGEVIAQSTAVINFYGGDVAGLPEGMTATGDGVINIYGLDTQPVDLLTSGNGQINIYNGAVPSLTATATAGGAAEYNVFGIAGMTNLRAEAGATVNVYGTAFLVNGVPRAFGPLNTAAGNLTDGGTTISFFRSLSPAGMINLVQIPEPASATLIVVAIGALVARRRVVGC